MAPRAILLDRDGVINVDRPDYVRHPEQLELLPNAAAAIALLKRHGVSIAVITNQACIGKGLASAAMVETIHQHLQQQLRAAGGTIDRFFVCPDAPDHATFRRKPKPGMLLEALEHFGAIAAETPFVGDAATDLEAAAAAGCPRYLVHTGKGEATAQALASGRLPASVNPVTVRADILQAAQDILLRFGVSE